jgi:hypothetical protein
VQLSRIGLDWAVASPAASDETQRRTHGTARTRACRHRASIHLPTSTTRHNTTRTAPEQWFCTGCALTDGFLRACPAHIGRVKGRRAAHERGTVGRRPGQVRSGRVGSGTYRARRLAYSTVGNGRQALVLNTPQARAVHAHAAHR